MTIVPRLIAIGVPISTVFGFSVIAFAKEKTARAFLQVLGAASLLLVVLTHVAEAFKLFPSMGWGLPNTRGHYIDLFSATAGLVLFPAGYLSRMFAQRKTAP